VSVESEVLAELDALRTAVAGVDGGLVATSDGLLVAHNLPGDGAEQIAALVSTVVAVARHAVEITGRGDLREATIRGDAGLVVVHAVGETAVLAVVCRADLNVALLYLHARPAVRRLAALAADFAGFMQLEAPAGSGAL
jgi:predicted regulator of Ras-like GTPase activity (Roadblock/LC7/MglB family)